jgi:photosystem II stability/assembly factor-like uncharacterized protein
MKKLILILCVVAGLKTATAQTWTTISVPTNKKLHTIDFPSNQVGYIGGADSTLLKSTDGGQSWQLVNPSGITWFLGGSDIQKIRFVTEQIGFMTVGPYGGTYKTTDGGNSWTALSLSNGLCFNEGLYFFDENNGFIGGTGCFQGEMIDQMQSGNIVSCTLNAASIDNSSMITDIDFYNSTLGLASAKGGRIYRTTDGGNQWDSISVQGFSLNSVAFVNDTLCYAGYSLAAGGFGLLRSLDGGISWAEDFSSATFFYPNFFGIHVSNQNKVYAGGYSSTSLTGLIFESSAIGNWNSAIVDQAIYSLASVHDSIVFGVGDSGYVVVNQPIPTSVQKQADRQKQTSVYPNPFNNLFQIEFTAMDEKPFQLTLTDLKGRVVKVLQYPAAQNCLFDAEGLPSGFYTLQILKEGKEPEFHKMIKQ